MTEILQSLGQNFRPVGPLTLANAVNNPSFEVDLTGWTKLDDASFVTLTRDTTQHSPNNGVASCKISVAANSTKQFKYGVYQLIETPYIYGQDWTLGAGLYLSANLPNDGSYSSRISSWIDYFDPDMNWLATIRQTMQNGTSTGGWIRASILDNDPTAVPYNAQYVGVGIVASASVTGSMPAFSFYVDEVLWVPSDDSTYADGDYAGYVWAEDAINSRTLKSGLSGDLRFFKTDTSIVPTPVVS